MRKIKVEFPDCVVAFIFLRHSARLTLAQRQHVLSACLNKYEADKVMDASCIQFLSVAELDRQTRHDNELEKRGPLATTVAQVQPLGLDDDVALGSATQSSSEPPPPELTKLVRESFATFHSAKQRLRTATQSRGFYKPNRCHPAEQSTGTSEGDENAHRLRVLPPT